MRAAEARIARAHIEQHSIVRAVRQLHSAGRTELASATGIPRTSLTAHVQQLMHVGILREDARVASAGGRPFHPVMLTDAGVLLLADLGATSLTVGIATSRGELLAHTEQTASIRAEPEETLGDIAAGFDALLHEHGIARPVWGIGISFPGPIEFATGSPIAPPGLPRWDGFQIRDYFQRRFGAATWVDNDVNVLALAEIRQGNAQGAAEALVVKVGTGIGVGLIAAHAVHRGNQGCAGNIGHTPTAADACCRCGKVGCLETVAGGDAIAKQAMELAQRRKSASLAARLAQGMNITAQDVAVLARSGDEDAITLLASAGRELGVVLAQLVNFFNPDLIVLSGGVSRAGSPFINAVRQAVHAHAMTLAARDLQVLPTRLGSDAGVIGCMHLVLDELLRPEMFSRWIAHGSPAGVLAL